MGQHIDQSPGLDPRKGSGAFSQSNREKEPDPAPGAACGSAAPTTAAGHSHMQVDLRLFARMEAAAVLLRGITELGRDYIREVRGTPEGTAAERAVREENQAHCVSGGINAGEGSTQAEKQDAADSPATDANKESAPPTSHRSRSGLEKPYAPRVHAAPIAVLAFRAAKLLLEVSPIVAQMAHEFITLGIDVEKEVYRRRMKDFINEELARLGVDLRNLSAADTDALNRALCRVNEIVDDAVKRMRDMPGWFENGRQRSLEELRRKYKPQGP